MRARQRSEAEIELLLRQTLRELCDQQARPGSWERLAARVRAESSAEAHLAYCARCGVQRYAPFIGMSCLWETLLRPQTWSRMTF